jgi:hypothetical protein
MRCESRQICSRYSTIFSQFDNRGDDRRMLWLWLRALVSAQTDDCAEPAQFQPNARQWVAHERTCCAWFTSIDDESHDVTSKMPPAMLDAFQMFQKDKKNGVRIQENVFSQVCTASVSCASNKSACDVTASIWHCGQIRFA